MHELVHAARTWSIFAIAAVGACGSEPEPTGPHYTYVVSAVTIPTSSSLVDELAFDLDDNGTKDNKLGRLLDTLTSQGVDLQGTLDNSLRSGAPILLVDFQTPDFTTSSGTGFELKIGQAPMPAPCTDANDPSTCGKHLDGSGSFTVSTSSTATGSVVGTVAGGTFDGGPGELAFAIALSDSPIAFQLIGARVKASGLSEDGLEEVRLGGAISEQEIDTTLIPAVHGQLVPFIERDCPSMTPPECGCATGSLGRTMLGLFDTDPKDCTVTVTEIKTNGLVSNLLRSDVTIDGVAAVSFGVKAQTVKAAIR